MSILRNRAAVAAAIDGAASKKQVLERLGLRAAGGNYAALDRWCATHDLELPVHQPRPPSARRSTEELLVEGSSVTSSQLRRRLIAEGLLDESCAWCGLGPTWRDQPLTLQLDHVNGIHSDNRLVNLRLLCPNCHTQTDGFAGRSAGAGRTAECVDCGVPVRPRSRRCRTCSSREQARSRTVIPWPSSARLAILVRREGYEATGRRLGVSAAAVRKRLRNHPPTSSA